MNPSDYGSDAYVNLKNNYDQALANYNYCITYTSNEKSNAQASVEVAKVALQQAQDTYNTLKNASGIDPNQLALNEAKVNQAQTQLAQAQKDLEGIVLTAPIDGKVIFVAANQGAIVDTTKFITIADMSHPTVEISLDETDLDKLVIGSKTQISFDALPEQVFNGTITQVEPQLVTSGNVQVARGYAELDETGAKAVQNLPLGLNASVVVIDKEATNVLIVPKEALRDLGNNDYAVFVVGQNGNLQLKPVKVGLTDSTRAEISSGLKEGDLVSTGAAQVK
jgi:RND family efflux transporter MFP subunit